MMDKPKSGATGGKCAGVPASAPTFRQFREAMQFFPLLPARIRETVRSRESGLAFAALCIGAVSGVLVEAMSSAVQGLHVLLFGIAFSTRLSASESLPGWRAFLVPALGGLCLAAIAVFVVPRLRTRIADAIEANALYGGKMSFRASLVLTLQTIVSSGFGASVGLEAGYTQLCAAVASWLGVRLAARRADLRMLVAAGAAGAIGAAFDAPLAGAFYAFEVVLGTYTVASLVPVAASALTAALVASEISGHTTYLLHHSVIGAVSGEGFVHTAAIGLLCAAVSIVLMEGVAVAEAGFNRLPVRAAFRPVAGGLLVGAMALATPQVLGAGHGAMRVDVAADLSVITILMLIVLKGVASAVSLGSGFRGGLFFSSLLIGSLVGKFYAGASAHLFPGALINPEAAAIVGMAALGTGVLGAPVTMTVMALETTGEISITVAALIGSSLASLIVRELFGYSFATWRFHLRGEVIRGPHDVGWVQDLTAAKMMRTDVATVQADMALGAVRDKFPLGATRQVVVVEAGDIYAGVVPAADLHASEADVSVPIGRMAVLTDTFLLPDTNIQRAIDAFNRSEADALVVVTSVAVRKVLGFVSEAYAFRRYGEELQKRNQEFTR